MTIKDLYERALENDMENTTLYVEAGDKKYMPRGRIKFEKQGVIIVADREVKK